MEERIRERVCVYSVSRKEKKMDQKHNLTRHAREENEDTVKGGFIVCERMEGR